MKQTLRVEAVILCIYFMLCIKPFLSITTCFDLTLSVFRYGLYEDQGTS